MSRATVKTNIDSTITTNGSNQITGLSLRGTLNETVDETLFIEDVTKADQNGNILLDTVGGGRWYGSDTAKTGSQTVSLTGAVVGGVAWIIHNDATEPTLTGAVKKNFTYNTVQINYIKLIYTKLSGTVLASTPFASENKSISSGAGSPEGVVIGSVGNVYLQTDGDQDSIIWRKVSGTGNTGWLSDQEAQKWLVLTDQATITWEVRNATGTGKKQAVVTLGGNRTLAEPTGAEDGDRLLLRIKQDATGGRTLTYDTKFKFVGSPLPRNHLNGEDLLNIVYHGNDDVYLCEYGREDDEHVLAGILTGGGSFSYNINSLSQDGINEHHGLKIMMDATNTASTHFARTLLPSLSKVWIGYKLHVELIQAVAEHGTVDVLVTSPDNIRFIENGNTPFLNQFVVDSIGLDVGQSYTLSCTLTCMLDNSSAKIWGLSNLSYEYIGGTKEIFSSSNAMSWDTLKGNSIEHTLTEDTTLSMFGQTSDLPQTLSGVMYIHTGGTAFEITLPSASKIQSPNALLVNTGGTRTIERLSINSDYVVTYVYNGTDFHWNISEYE